MFQLALPFLVAFAVALGVTPVVRWLARRFGLVATPSSDRWHVKPTALMGGVAVYVGVIAGALAALVVVGEGNPFATLGRGGIGILVGSSLMFVIGLADDKLKLRPSTKLIFQSLAAATLISTGVIYPVSDWMVLNVLVTFFWFLALTNALNLLDNMDGVAIGVTGIAALFLAATFAWEGAVMLAAVCLALAGAAAGFLPYNFHRASIFMGDSGSLFIGALLAGLGAAYPSTAPGSIVAVMFVPALIVIIPILDTLLVTVARTMAGRPISVGGRDHTSHRLVAMGLSERQVALLLYGFAASGGVLALLLRGASPAFGLTFGAIFLVGLLLFAAYLGRMHTYAPTEAPRGKVTLLITDLLHKRRAFEVVLDLILFAVAYQAAYLLRWDGSVPPSQLALFEGTLAVAVVAKSAAFGAMGVYRGTWYQAGIADLHRILRAAVVGGLLTVAAASFLIPAGEFSRSIFILDGLLAAVLVMGSRVAFRSLDSVRHSLHKNGDNTLLFGAGQGGELVLREIRSNADIQLHPVAFVDDDPAKLGRLLQGLPVLGGLDALPQIATRRSVEKVVLCTRKMAPEREEQLIGVCRDLGLELLHLHLELRPLVDPPIDGVSALPPRGAAAPLKPVTAAQR